MLPKEECAAHVPPTPASFGGLCRKTVVAARTWLRERTTGAPETLGVRRVGLGALRILPQFAQFDPNRICGQVAPIPSELFLTANRSLDTCTFPFWPAAYSPRLRARAFASLQMATFISERGLYLCRQQPEFILSLPKSLALSPSKGLPHTWRVQYHRAIGASLEALRRRERRVRCVRDPFPITGIWYLRNPPVANWLGCAHGPSQYF
jgi:hypothetical protein